MIRLGLRAHVILLAMLLATMIALVLIGYHLKARLQDIDQALLDRGQGIVHQLAPAAEYAVFSGNRELLDRLARAVLREPDVISVIIRNIEGATLAHVMKTPVTELDTPPSNEPLTFRASIYRTEVEVEYAFDFSHPPTAGARLPDASESQVAIGTVDLTMSQNTTYQRQQEVIRNSLLLSLCCIVAAIAVSGYVGHRITRPIIALEQSVRRLRDGELSVRVPARAFGEIGSLQAGFNAMAAALETARQHLQTKIDEATQSLQKTVTELQQKNADLDAAHEQALAASRAKSAFLAMMSHEIRTPMNAVIGFIEVLRKTPLNAEQSCHLRTIRAAADHLVAILNDLLDFARLEANRLVLDRHDFAVREVIEDAFLLYAFQAREKGLDYVLDITPHLPARLHGDPVRVAQVVSNLVSNAIKFTEQGQVNIQVNSEPQPNQQVMVQLAVSDTGIGIAPNDIQRLFESFGQLDTSRTRRHSGVGLGLVITQRLVELMNGGLHLTSQPDVGSTFYATFLLETAGLITSRTPIRESAPTVFLLAHSDAAGRAIRHMLEFAGLSVIMMLKRLDELTACLATTGTVLIILDLQALSGPLPATLVDTFSTRHRWILIGDRDHPVAQQLSGRREVAFAPWPPVHRDAVRLVHSWYPDLDEARADSRSVPTALPSPRVKTQPQVRALVVDDNRFNRRVMKALLEQINVDVVSAANGQEAIEACQKAKYDIIFMDIYMPDMDGFTAAGLIKNQHSLNGDTPIVAVTADALSAGQPDAVAPPFSGWVCKPVTEEMLMQVLRQWAPGY